MRRGRLILILLLFILLLLLCGVLFLRFQSPGAPGPAAPSTPEPVQTVDVVVTTQEIRRGQRITEEMITLQPVPLEIATNVPYLLNPEDAIGQLAARDLPAGILLTEGDVVPSAVELAATGSVAALQIPPGYVAISIPINRLTSVSYAIQPGDVVGILVTLPFVELDPEFQSRLPNLSASLVQNGLLIGRGTERPAAEVPAAVPAPPQEGAQFVGGETLQTLVVQVVPGEAPVGRVEEQGDFTLYTIPSEIARPRLVSQMIVSDAVVLYVGTFPWQRPEALAAQAQLEQQAEAQEVEPGAQPPLQQQPPALEGMELRPPDVVTLIVRPQDAVTLKYLMDRQVVFTLVLRSYEDTEPLQTDPVTLTYLLEEYNIVVPSRQLFDLEPRIDQVDMPVLPNDIPVQPTPQP